MQFQTTLKYDKVPPPITYHYEPYKISFLRQTRMRRNLFHLQQRLLFFSGDRHVRSSARDSCTAWKLSTLVLLTRQPVAPVRLDQLLKYQADMGVKVYILLCKEVSGQENDSGPAEKYLKSLSKINVFVTQINFQVLRPLFFGRTMKKQ